MNKTIFNSLISGLRVSSNFDSTLYFDGSSTITDTTPISRFVSLRKDLIVILGADDSSEQWRIKANLVILGIVSGVESYFREMTRKLLLVDDDSRVISYGKGVSYGAALFHHNDLLPEALLEDCSFASKKNIIENIKGFLGVSINPQQNTIINNALDEFEKVCQLRHCIAHRSGLLGSKNAIALGLDKHSDFLEKPIKASFDSINNSFSICQNLIFEINDFVFQSILHRGVTKGVWTGNLTKDKKSFRNLFNIFSPDPANEVIFKDLYRLFVLHYDLK